MNSCECPCHTIEAPHKIECVACRPLPISWYPCSYCGAAAHVRCSIFSNPSRQYPMGQFHKIREETAKRFNSQRGYHGEVS